MLVLASACAASAAATLDVYFINVGHGDAILIDCGDWEALIDIGPNCQTASDRVADIVREHVEDRAIELFILTHAHGDHFGGFEPVMKALNTDTNDYSIGSYWVAADTEPATDTTPTGNPTEYSDYMDALRERAPQAVQSQRLLRVDAPPVQTASLTWRVLAPVHPNANAKEDSAINANSLVLLLEYHQVRFIFAGDLEKGPSSMGSWAIPKEAVLVLKAPHHGCKESALEDLIEHFSPALVIFSTDLCVPNDVGTLVAEGIPFLTTAHAGLIHLSTDGSSVWVTTDTLSGRSASERCVDSCGGS